MELSKKHMDTKFMGKLIDQVLLLAIICATFTLKRYISNRMYCKKEHTSDLCAVCYSVSLGYQLPPVNTIK